jgi:hypothetical protein
MVRVPRSGSQQAPPLLERIARAICEEYRGDPNAEFAGLPMWHQFLPDAHALLPVVVSIANDISQSAGKPLLTKKPPVKSVGRRGLGDNAPWRLGSPRALTTQSLDQSPTGVVAQTT